MMWLKLSVILNILLNSSITALYVGDRCEPNGQISDGVCAVVTDCPIAINSIKKKGSHDYLRCGFNDFMEVICCPTTDVKFGTSDEQITKSKQERIADRECKKIIENSIPPLDLHIIGGEAATLGEFPHMVALGFDRGDGYSFDCGGSVLSTTYVLTAAHCIDNKERIAPTIVRTGVIELGDNTWNNDIDVRISETLMHPNYTTLEKYHDLALLRLEKPLQFSSNLQAVCLDTGNDDPKAELTITGWGKISSSRDIRSNMLLKANVSFVARDKCGESYTGWRKLPRGISDEQMCAGDPDGLRDTCQGDSGGPIQQLVSKDGQYRLIGVTSFGRGCGSPIPGVYTRINRYVDWIESVVWKN